MLESRAPLATMAVSNRLGPLSRLEQALFGIADPTGHVIAEDSVDEEAIEDELEEDLLAVADENNIDLADDSSPESTPGEDEEP